MDSDGHQENGHTSDRQISNTEEFFRTSVRSAGFNPDDPLIAPQIQDAVARAPSVAAAHQAVYNRFKGRAGPQPFRQEEVLRAAQHYAAEKVKLLAKTHLGPGSTEPDRAERMFRKCCDEVLFELWNEVVPRHEHYRFFKLDFHGFAAAIRNESSYSHLEPGPALESALAIDGKWPTFEERIQAHLIGFRSLPQMVAGECPGANLKASEMEPHVKAEAQAVAKNRKPGRPRRSDEETRDIQQIGVNLKRFNKGDRTYAEIAVGVGLSGSNTVANHFLGKTAQWNWIDAYAKLFQVSVDDILSGTSSNARLRWTSHRTTYQRNQLKIASIK